MRRGSSDGRPVNLPSHDILIVGAGVLGLATAAELALRGRASTVIDPGDVNASAVAAGMIAPAFESLLENASSERATLLKSARDLWPAFADRAGLNLLRDGAEWIGDSPHEAAERLAGLGFEVRLDDGVVFTPDDWRIEPVPALSTLARTAGVTVRRGRVDALKPEDGRWTADLSDGAALSARLVILASGAAPPVEGLPADVQRLLALIRPIRGQIERLPFSTGARSRRVTGGYASPLGQGMVVGASMDVDRRDLAPDPKQTRRMMETIGAALGVSGSADRVTQVGVRGATPDGLPIAGALGGGIYAALAPRRNGWLLAPAVAAVAADAIEGEPKTAFAAAFDPERF